MNAGIGEIQAGKVQFAVIVFQILFDISDVAISSTTAGLGVT